MSDVSLPGYIEQLSLTERLQLVEQIWDSIAEQPTALPLTDAQRAELDRRLAADDESPEEGLTWEEVKKQITDQL